MESINVPEGPTSDSDRTTGSLSWLQQLHAYLATQGHDTSIAATAQRQVLVSAVQALPHNAGPWLRFLQHEETLHALTDDDCDGDGSSSKVGRGRAGVSLYHLYQKATELVRRGKGQAPDLLLELWLGYARLQWQRNEDEARETFKTLKNQRIGDNSAFLYHTWAKLESQSDTAKAIVVLHKGLKEHAQPASILETLCAELQSGVCALEGGMTDPLTGPPSTAPAAGRTATQALPGCSFAKLWLGTANKGATSHLGWQEHRCSNNGHVVPLRLGTNTSTLPAADSTSLANNAVNRVAAASSNGVAQAILQQPANSSSSRSTTSLAPTDLSLHLSSQASMSRTMCSSVSGEDTIHCRGEEADTSKKGYLNKAKGMAGLIKKTARGGATPASKDHTARAATTSAHNVDALQRMQAMQVYSNTGNTGNAASIVDTAASNTATLGATGNNTGNVGTGTLKRFAFKTGAMRLASGPARVPLQAGAFMEAPVATVETAATLQAADPAASRSQAAMPPSSAEPAPIPSTLEPSSTASPMVTDEMEELLAAAEVAVIRKRRADGSMTAEHPEQQPLSSTGVTPAPHVHSRSIASNTMATTSGAHSHGTSQEHVTEGGAAMRSQLPPVAAPPHVLLRHQPASALKLPSDENRAPAAPPPAHSTAQGALDSRTKAAQQAVALASSAQPGIVPLLPRCDEPSVVVVSGELREPLRPIVVQPQAQTAVASPASLIPHPQQQQQQLSATFNSSTVATTMANGSSAAFKTGPPPLQLGQAQLQPIEDAQWVFVRSNRYQKLDCIGKGGSSKVFKVLAINKQIYALKRVRLQNRDPEAINGFIDEIRLLNQLRGKPNIIQLVDAQVFKNEGLIYMVLEHGDIDLARLLHNHSEARRTHGGGAAGEIDENFIRLYWQQMLQAVRCIHDLRIVHSDLKPANFLLVQGTLKLIDFGIAKSIQDHTTSIDRDAPVGTLNYMAPEAIMGGSVNPLGGAPTKVGCPSDIWSLGCILYQMIYGSTPFATVSFPAKMGAICSPGHAVHFPPCANPAAVDVMQRCLDRHPKTRIGMQELLDHPFLHPERRPAELSQPATAGHTSTQTSLLCGLTEEQFKAIVSQVALASASGVADIEALTRQVRERLTGRELKASPAWVAGEPPATLLAVAPAPAAGGSRIPTPLKESPMLPPITASVKGPTLVPKQAPPPPPPNLPPPPAPSLRQLPKPAASAAGGKGMAGIAAAAAAAAACRATAVAGQANLKVVVAPRAAPVGGQGMLMGGGKELQAAIVERRSQLKRTETRSIGNSRPSASAASSGHQTGLQHGMEHFHLEDPRA